MDEWQRQQRERARQERTNTRAASESLSNYKGSGVRDEDLKLQTLRQEDRRKKQEAHAAMSRYSGTGVSEEALKLKKLKDEQRQKERESKELLNKAQFNEVKIMPKDKSKYNNNKMDPEHLPPVVRKQDDDVDFGSVKEKAGLYHHDYDPALGSPRNTKQKSPRLSSASGDDNETESVPFVDEESPQTVSELAAGLDKAAENNSPEEDEAPNENAEEETTTDKAETPEETTDPASNETESTPVESTDDNDHNEATATPPSEDTMDQQQPTSTDEQKEAIEDKEEEEETIPVEEKKETEQLDTSTKSDPPTSSDAPSEPPAPSNDEDPEAPKVHHLTPTEIDQAQKKEIQGRKFKVRLDVLFSFGLLTSSEKPYLDNYMGAVEEVVKATLQANDDLRAHCWYDPGYGPFVQEYTTDEHWKDPQKRPNVRRILVIAAIPIFLTNGISIRKAREGVCAGLQRTMKNGEFVAIAKRGGYVDQPSSTRIKDDKYAIM